MAITINEMLTSIHGRLAGLNKDRAFTVEHGLGAITNQTVYPRMVHTGGIPAQAAADGTDATPSTTEVYLAEALMPFRSTVTGVALFNGSVAAGNVFVAVYDSDGVLITGTTSGAVAMSGTDSYQRVPFSGGAMAIRGPRSIWIAAMYSSATARFNTHVTGSFGAGKLTGWTNGTFQGTTASPITLPTTFTTGLGPIASLY
jgi:hypothetical protein